jgi:hypothetical protein
MVKLTKKALIGIIVAVVVVVACVSVFLLTRPPEIERPRELYGLSFNYKPGETYIYDTSTTMEVMGQKIETTGRDEVEVLEVEAEEITLRYHSTSKAVSAPQMPQTTTAVYEQVITPKGKAKSTNLVKVDPPKLKAQMEQTLEQQQLFQTASYPTESKPIGGKWKIPIEEAELTIMPGVQLKLKGYQNGTIASKETLVTPAGQFDCLKLISKIWLTGEGTFGKDQNLTMDVSGETTSWVDIKSFVPVKQEMHMEIKEQLGTAMTMELPMDITTELIEYKRA